MDLLRRRVALCLIGCGILLAFALMLLPAHAAAPRATTRPPQFIAAAEPAVVRLTVQYSAQTAGGVVPVAALCTGLGTIVAPGGAGTLAAIVTDAQLLSPVEPCQGVRIAYQNATKTPPTGWHLDAVMAYLATNYTGAAPNQAGMSAFSINTQAITTNGLTDGPVVVPLAASAAPAYDLPSLALGDAQPNGATQLLDLGLDGQPYTQDTITANVLPGALTVVTTGVMQPPIIPTPTAVATGTAHPTATPVPISLTPAPPADLSLGAPLVVDAGNGVGTLGGMVVQVGKGLGIVSAATLAQAVHAANLATQPGAFDQHWDSGLDAYYAASPSNAKDPEYAAAAQQFQYLQTHYVAFGGVAPWLSSALAGSPELGATPSPTATATPVKAPQDIIPGIPIHSEVGLIALGGAVAALLIGLLLWMVALSSGRRARRRRVAAALAAGAAAAPSRNGTGHGAALSLNDSDVTAKAPAIKNGQIERRASPDEVSLAWKSTVSRPTLPLPQVRQPRRLGMQATGITDPGVRRRESPNQDSILAVQGARMHEGAPQAFGLFIVADGMGGHQFGREASNEAIRVMAEHILQPLLGGDHLDDENLLDLIKNGVERANGRLHYRNISQRSDMGTTVTAALVTGDMGFVVNVGDSRTYHLQPNLPIRQVTNDHSVVASLVAAGVIEPDDIYTHPKRSQIFRSLGEQEDVQVDTFNVVLQPGDQLLLCSDGLWEMVRNPRIEEMLRSYRDLHDLSEALVEEANGNGGVDNISAIVVRMLNEDATPKQLGMHILAGPPSFKGI
jgi:serine/threonine protein phosphatase PrpC